MTGIAISAVAGVVALITLVLFARWVISTMRSDARDNATLNLRAERAEANAKALGERLGEEISHREALQASLARVAGDALRVGTDADAVELAGGDAGPGRLGDGLLDPFATPTTGVSDGRAAGRG